LPTPDGITLAAEYKYNPVHELEGDIEALKLVDLVSLILMIISKQFKVNSSLYIPGIGRTFRIQVIISK
jgi:hypothetical protein